MSDDAVDPELEELALDPWAPWNTLERIDAGEVLEPELDDYFELVAAEDLARRVVVGIALMSMVLEALEARGSLPAVTRAARFAVPHVDLYTVTRE